MEDVLHLREQRLKKMYQKQEMHGWYVSDPWIQNKIYKNKITNTLLEVSYVTKDKYNPLPFHLYIHYVGIIHHLP